MKCMMRRVDDFLIAMVVVAGLFYSIVPASAQSVALKGPQNADDTRITQNQTGLRGLRGQAASNVRYGPITDSDTLWNIAKTYRPSPSINITQMMVAILKYNPNAFENNNLNELVNGNYLTIPSADFIAAISLREAQQKFEQDQLNWRARRQGTSVTPSTDAAAPKKLSVVTSDKLLPQREKSVVTQAKAPSTVNDKQTTERLEQQQKQVGALINNMQNIMDQNKVLASQLDDVNDEVERLRDEINRYNTLERQVNALAEQQDAQQSAQATVNSSNSQLPEAPPTALNKTPETDAGFIDSPLFLILASVIPSLGLLSIAGFLLFRKRSKKIAPEAQQQDTTELPESPTAIAQELANEMASDELFAEDELLEELQDSELNDFDDFTDELLIDDEKDDESELTLLAFDDDVDEVSKDQESEQLISDDTVSMGEQQATDNVVSEPELAGAFDIDDIIDTQSNGQSEEGSDDTLAKMQLDQQGLDALFDNDDSEQLAANSIQASTVDSDAGLLAEAVLPPEVPAEEMSVQQNEEDSRQDNEELKQVSEIEKAIEDAAQGVDDQALDKLIQLDEDSDEVVSEELVQSIVSEISNRAEQFETLSSQVLGEIEQVEQLEQMLGTSMVDLADDVDDILNEEAPIEADAADPRLASDYQEQQDELPLEHSKQQVTVEDDQSGSEPVDESSIDGSIDEPIAQIENEETDDLTQALAEFESDDSELSDDNSELESNTKDQAQEKDATPSMSTSFDMSMATDGGGYSTMQASSAEPTSAAPQAPSSTENADGNETDILDELEETDFEELLESLANQSDTAQAHGDPNRQEDISQQALQRPDLDLEALLDSQVEGHSVQTEAAPTQAAEQQFIDVDDILDEVEDDEFIEKPFDLDTLLPPIDETTEQTDHDDKGLGGKLDLALAYIEIDDAQAARTLLQDVIERGDSAQRTEANAILEKLA